MARKQKDAPFRKNLPVWQIHEFCLNEGCTNRFGGELDRDTRPHVEAGGLAFRVDFRILISAFNKRKSRARLRHGWASKPNDM